MHGGNEVLFTAEAPGDLENVAVAADRWHPEDIGQDELRGAVLGVLLEHFVEDFSGFRAVAAEEIRPLLPQSLGTFATGPEGSVESDVAQQIQRIGVRLLGSCGKLVEVDAAFFELVDDLGAPAGVRPIAPQLRGVAADAADLVCGVVGELQDPDLVAVRVHLVDQVRGDLDLSSIEVELARRLPGTGVREMWRDTVTVRLAASQEVMMRWTR